MNVRKFIAANTRDALRKVKETLGNDAIILSNRGVPGGVEIMAVAARDMAMIVPTPVADSAPAQRPRRRWMLMTTIASYSIQRGPAFPNRFLRRPCRLPPRSSARSCTRPYSRSRRRR